MKATPKVTTTTTEEAKATPTVKVSAILAAKIAPMATAITGAEAGVRAAERQVIDYALLVSKDSIMAKAGRKEAQRALIPLFTEAYAKVKKDKLYAGQQLSRVLLIAFGPASEKVTDKQRAKLLANRDKAIAKGEDTLKVIGLAGGSLTYAKGDTIAKVVKSTGSGGGNRKSPTDTYNTTVGDAVTQAVVGKVPPLAQIIGLLSALVACEAIDQDEADEIEEAAKKAL